MRRIVLVTLLPLVAGLAATVATTPADAGTPYLRGVITFHKNPKHPDDSLIVWSLRKRVHGEWTVVDRASWRAGSGMLGKRGRNSCIHNVGWLPDGRYRVRQYADYPGHFIKGRAFRLDDKACARGVVRHNLFIHTEQGAHDRQCRDRRGDQPCRWEFPRIDDYKSAGCIKMAPDDLAALVRHFHQAFHAGIRYPKSRMVLKVVTG